MFLNHAEENFVGNPVALCGGVRCHSHHNHNSRASAAGRSLLGRPCPIVADSSSQMYVTLFNEQGTAIMGGKTADELELLRETDEATFQKLVGDAIFKTYHMRLKIKDEVYQEQNRQAATVMSIMPVDYVKECAELIKAIGMYS